MISITIFTGTAWGQNIYSSLSTVGVASQLGSKSPCPRPIDSNGINTRATVDAGPCRSATKPSATSTWSIPSSPLQLVIQENDVGLSTIWGNYNLEGVELWRTKINSQTQPCNYNYSYSTENLLTNINLWKDQLDQPCLCVGNSSPHVSRWQ